MKNDIVYVYCIYVDDKYSSIIRNMSNKGVSITIINIVNKFDYIEAIHPHVSKTAMLKFDIPNFTRIFSM